MSRSRTFGALNSPVSPLKIVMFLNQYFRTQPPPNNWQLKQNWDWRVFEKIHFHLCLIQLDRQTKPGIRACE